VSTPVWLYRLGDLSVPRPLPAVRGASLTAGPGFDPDSLHMGIIAILIGLVRGPAPTLSLQAGDTHYVYVFDGARLVPLLEQRP
jgi:hypothetical protein